MNALNFSQAFPPQCFSWLQIQNARYKIQNTDTKYINEIQMKNYECSDFLSGISSSMLFMHTNTK